MAGGGPRADRRSEWVELICRARRSCAARRRTEASRRTTSPTSTGEVIGRLRGFQVSYGRVRALLRRTSGRSGKMEIKEMSETVV